MTKENSLKLKRFIKFKMMLSGFRDRLVNLLMFRKNGKSKKLETRKEESKISIEPIFHHAKPTFLKKTEIRKMPVSHTSVH